MTTTKTATSPLDVQVGGNHYKDMKIQPVEFIHANQLGFMEGAVIKYVSRWREKGGVTDLEKARHFVDMLIDLETKALAEKAVAKAVRKAKRQAKVVKAETVPSVKRPRGRPRKTAAVAPVQLELPLETAVAVA